MCRHRDAVMSGDGQATRMVMNVWESISAGTVIGVRDVRFSCGVMRRWEESGKGGGGYVWKGRWW